MTTKFQLGQRVLLGATKYKHGLPAKIVGFRGELVRVVLYVSGCEICVPPAELSHKETPSA